MKYVKAWLFSIYKTNSVQLLVSINTDLWLLTVTDILYSVRYAVFFGSALLDDSL
jgi:hypothetical protein